MLPENAGNQHFLLSPQRFQKASFQGSLKKSLNTLTKRQDFRLIQIENICRRQNKFEYKIRTSFGKGRKRCGKRRKCWLPTFSPFPTMFSKGFFPRVVKSRDCVVKN